MSSVQLLDKTRKIGKLLHNNNSSKVVFTDICKVIRDIVNSNVLVISKKGKVLGVGTCEGVDYPAYHAFSLQFHPEAHGGPLDCQTAFDRFVDTMKEGL